MKIKPNITDYVAAVLMGTGTVFLVSLLVDGQWNTLLGMASGMLLGLLAMVAVFFMFMRISTAFHLFPVGMPITMSTGMISGMSAASGAFRPEVLYPSAVAISVLVQFAVDWADAAMRGDVPIEK